MSRFKTELRGKCFPMANKQDPFDRNGLPALSAAGMILKLFNVSFPD